MQYLLLLIITIPSFISLFNLWFFTMHDFQHIARLYVLDQAIHQGQIYARWVDLFGFNFGYPLFNFYPPLIYYIAEIARLSGATYVMSIKYMLMAGYLIGAWGMYKLGKRLTDSRVSGLICSVLYTFFTYHAVLVYVRGAFAEFFAMSILPYIFLSLHVLREKNSLLWSMAFAFSFALLIVAHPLIAFPSLIFIGLFFLFLLFTGGKQKISFTVHSLLGGIVGLGLSAFFWLPSMAERSFTVVDEILTKDLASYTLHFVEPFQLWFSPWGFGGSGGGLADSMSFQLGKIHIGFALLSIVTFLFALRNKEMVKEKKDYLTFVVLCALSIFMCMPYSQFVWDNVRFLWYLQFPWRFLTFAGIFMPVLGAYAVLFILRSVNLEHRRILGVILFLLISAVTIGTYHKYFKPEQFITKSDNDLTSFDEIAWRVSSSSFEFSPKGIPFRLSEYGTQVFDIGQSDLRVSSYGLQGEAQVKVVKKTYKEKAFEVQTENPVIFQLNTFYFPGWKAYIDNDEVAITDNNRYKLITVTVPRGVHRVRFEFTNTPIRTAGNSIATGSLLVLFILIFIEEQTKKIKIV